MNTIFRAEMAIRAHAHYVDIWRTLAADDGKYTDHVLVNGKRTRVRSGDGVHLSTTGAHYLVSVVAPQLGAILTPAAVATRSPS